MFQKRQRLTIEGATKLLLDTLEYQALVNHIGSCHYGAVHFEVWTSEDLHIFSTAASARSRIHSSWYWLLTSSS